MAYSYTWPSTLPQSPQKGFTENVGAAIISTSMDTGIAKRRYRGSNANTMQLTFIMTDSQVTTLESFALGPNYIRGTARFGFKHPRTQAMVETRFIPQNAGNLYNLTYLAPGYWTVSMQLEILP